MTTEGTYDFAFLVFVWVGFTDGVYVVFILRKIKIIHQICKFKLGINKKLLPKVIIKRVQFLIKYDIYISFWIFISIVFRTVNFVLWKIQSHNLPRKLFLSEIH